MNEDYNETKANNLFPVEYHSKTFSFKQYTNKKKIPLFKLPVGFHAFSLINIAHYYAETATELYNMLIFDENCPDFSSVTGNEVDFSNYFDKIVNFYMKKEKATKSEMIEFLFRYSDRNSQINDKNMLLTSLNLSQPIIMNVPKGKEKGIIYSLSNSRNFDVPQIFVVDTTQDNIPRAVNVTAAQPFIFNDVVENEFPLHSSIEKKQEKAHVMLNGLSVGLFELQWALTAIDGIYSLIICRNPFFFRICDYFTYQYNAIEDAFGNSRILLVSYKFSAFSPLTELYCDTCVSPLHTEAIPADSYFLDLSAIKYIKYIDEKARTPILASLQGIDTKELHTILDLKDVFVDFLRESIEYPCCYFSRANCQFLIAKSASIFLQYPNYPVQASTVAQSLMRVCPTYEQSMQATNDYNRFILWIRSLTTAMKSITNGNIDRLLQAFSSCFYALPGRMNQLVCATIRLVMNSLNIFRKRRGMNDDFFEQILFYFRHVLGDDFDKVLGFNRFDIFKSVRTILVTTESCAQMFTPLVFNNQIISPIKAVYKFNKAVDSLKQEKGIELIFDDNIYDLRKEFVEFLQSQVYDPTVLQ